MAFEDLKVWHKGKDLTKEIYRLVKLLPKEETYALSDQMRRAAISVPSNIAEGYGRESTKEYINFLSYAEGSVCELKTQLIIAVEIGYLKEEDIKTAKELCNDIRNIIPSMIRTLKEKI